MKWFWSRRPAPEPLPINDLAPVIEDNTEYLPFGAHPVCPKCGSVKVTRRFREAGQVEARIRHVSDGLGFLGYHVLAWREKRERLEVSCPCGFSWVELPADTKEER